ncbi:uncharacterized protein LOC129601306 [Paramacrobiotus metropolitanus]|uniref:uncharacterized protein LOC129601306 n=1 Tax=Paramacrobiotus metropolitanus TaxID=2943436 RepID=UPI002445C6C7|nr:uncharacterized protein LOC129601306 [Paramacrobiotus metropolitanus]
MELDLEFQLEVGFEPWPYRRFGRSVSSGNTVMVLLNNAWYLGFIEDISDDQQQIFVNFRCSELPAAWLPAHRVFPHALFTEAGGSFYTVLAALRREPSAPLIFRPAAVVGFCLSGPGLMCCVQTRTDAGAQRHLLHPLQIAAERPPRRPLLLLPPSPRECVYAAYTTDTVDVAHINSIDENRLQFEMRRAVYAAQCRALNGRPRQTYGGVQDIRYYMRLSKDSVKFLIWQRQESDYPWNPEMLSECVRRCLDSGILANKNINAAAFTRLGCSAISHEADDCGRLTSLPLEIVECLFDMMDIVTRTTIQRVSPIWNGVAKRCCLLQRHCVIDLGLRVRSANMYDEMYRLGQQLYYGLGSAVQTLVLTRWRPGEHWLAERSHYIGNSDVTVIRQIVRILRPVPAAIAPTTRPVQRIVCHRCVVSGDLPTDWSMVGDWPASADTPLYFPLYHLSPLMDVCCGQLILLDYVQNDALQHFHHLRPFWHPADWTPLTDEPYQSRDPAPPLRVAVPFLRLDCTDQDAVGLLSTMRAAMEAALSEPSPEMRRMATDMYEFWRTRDTYWPFLRHLFTATEPGGPTWQHADFPSTPLPQLSRLTVFALDSMWYACNSAAGDTEPQ